LIAELLDLRVDVPYDIMPGVRLCRGSPLQVKFIKDFVFRAAGFGEKRARLTYELEQRAPDSSGKQWFDLPPESWRYFVFAFGEAGKQVSDFQIAVSLGEPPLTIFSALTTREPFGQGFAFSWSVDAIQVTDWYTPTQEPVRAIVDQATLAHITGTYDAVVRLDAAKYPGILRALSSFQATKRIARGSDLLALALFSIIEMLLTHNPNDKEIGDSLMHQIRTKIALLSERFVHKLDYSCFPDAKSADKVWSTLYSFRSRVAHGGEVDFAKNDLRLLVSRENALGFLQVATRRLLRHALEEPSLVEALKPI
jgi:Apea-like HEPN